MFYRILPTTLEHIKERFMECTGMTEDVFNEQVKKNAKSQYYLKSVQHNVMKAIAPRHMKEFSSGKNAVPELCYIGSSCALLYNILGNERVTVRKNEFGVPSGTYEIYYRKKLRTMKSKNAFVSIDAELFHIRRKECVLVESKMLEWFVFKINPIKDNFFRKENYYFEDTAEVFMNVFRRLIPFYNRDEWEHTSGFQEYDGLLAIRQVLGLYNMLRLHQENQKELMEAGIDHKLRDLERVKLVLCYWMAQHPEIYGNYIGRILSAEERMHMECAFLKEMMQPIVELFRNGLGIELSIEVVHYKDFIQALARKKEEQIYLKRYDV